MPKRFVPHGQLRNRWCGLIVADRAQQAPKCSRPFACIKLVDTHLGLLPQHVHIVLQAADVTQLLKRLQAQHHRRLLAARGGRPVARASCGSCSGRALHVLAQAVQHGLQLLLRALGATQLRLQRRDALQRSRVCMRVKEGGGDGRGGGGMFIRVLMM